MKFLTFILSILCTIGSLVHAQSPRKITFRTIFPDRPEDAPNKLFLYNGRTSSEIALPKSNLSIVNELESDGALKFVLTPTAVANPGAIPAGAPSFVVPEGVTDFYLICISDPANSVAPVSVKILDISAGKLKLGETLWYNLTKHTIQGELGNEKLIIMPSSTEVMKSPIDVVEGSYQVGINYVCADTKRTFPICQSVWTHHNSVRWLGFVFQQPGSRTPRVMTFRDYRPKNE